MGNWKKKHHLLWITAAVFYGLFLLNYVAYGRPVLPDEAKALVESHVKGQVNFDKAALARVTHSQYFEISPVGEFDTREKMLGFYDAPRNGPGPEVSILDWEYRQFGPQGVVSAKLVFKMRAGEQIREFAMRGTYLLCDEAGQLKICSANYTPMTPRRGS